MELEDHPGKLPVTQADYDFAKQIFDLSDATECFGFRASQDNGALFEESLFDFFFLKEGPQLVLAHLESRRPLRPGEEREASSGWEDDSYAAYPHWDKLLHSSFFWRFSEIPFGTRTYSFANQLIEKPWGDYYHSTQPAP